MEKPKGSRAAEKRLRDAAPEMLRVLKKCRAWVVPDVEHYEDGGGDEWAAAVPLLRAINAAIAKAEGRSE